MLHSASYAEFRARIKRGPDPDIVARKQAEKEAAAYARLEAAETLARKALEQAAEAASEAKRVEQAKTEDIEAVASKLAEAKAETKAIVYEVSAANASLSASLEASKASNEAALAAVSGMAETALSAANEASGSAKSAHESVASGLSALRKEIAATETIAKTAAETANSIGRRVVDVGLVGKKLVITYSDGETKELPLPGANKWGGGAVWTNSESVSGSAALTVVTVSSEYTVTSDNVLVLVDASAGDVSVHLPAASAKSWRNVNIKKISTGLGNVLIDAGADSVENDSQLTLRGRLFPSVHVVSDDVSGWWVT